MTYEDATNITSESKTLAILHENQLKEHSCKLRVSK